MDVIAIFDVGKTNKKIILFNSELQVIYEKEVRFDEIPDDDGFMGDDIVLLENWIEDTLIQLDSKYIVKAVNFSTYGASLIFLDADGNRLTPLYNYLKKLPKVIENNIYNNNGGKEEFARATASPTLGFLNSGLQIKWLSKEKPEVYKKVAQVLHFPQYLSYKFTGQISSEYTSIGCHTALWNFDNQEYHKWVSTLDFSLPEPISNSTLFEGKYGDVITKFGIGIHDSSSALVPYLISNEKEFILVSTGTWSIAMNPFNKEPLTKRELEDDCLCFLSIKQEQVKSSRLFMGHIHEVNAKMLSEHFGVANNEYKKVKFSFEEIESLDKKYDEEKVFFSNGFSESFIDETVDLSQFTTYAEAYHQLMIDLTWHSIKSIENVIPASDKSEQIFVTGGFAKNEIYIKLLEKYFIDKKIYTSEIDNASALGAAAVIWKEINKDQKLNLDLGLRLSK